MLAAGALALPAPSGAEDDAGSTVLTFTTWGSEARDPVQGAHQAVRERARGRHIKLNVVPYDQMFSTSTRSSHPGTRRTCSAWTTATSASTRARASCSTSARTSPTTRSTTSSPRCGRPSRTTASPTVFPTRPTSRRSWSTPPWSSRPVSIRPPSRPHRTTPGPGMSSRTWRPSCVPGSPRTSTRSCTTGSSAARRAG